MKEDNMKRTELEAELRIKIQAEIEDKMMRKSLDKYYEYRGEIAQAAREGNFRKVSTSADMASVKVFLGGGAVYLNGNGSDGRQTVFIAPDGVELPTLPIDVIFDAPEGSYICLEDCGNEKAEGLPAGRYIAFNGGGLVLLQRLKAV